MFTFLIITFKNDHELEIGQEISSGLLSALRASKIFVVVISENYARSPWCLDELVDILTRKAVLVKLQKIIKNVTLWMS